VLYDIKLAGFYVINVNLGPFAVVGLLPLLDLQEGNLNFSTYSLIIDNSKLSDYKSGNEVSQRDFKIGDEKISSLQLIAFASAFSILFPNEDFTGLNNDTIIHEQVEFKNRKIFKVAGFSLLVFFFVLLLINYMFFSHYKEENEKLSMESSIYSGMIDEVTKLETVVAEKEYFLKGAGWLAIPKTSYYADRIAEDVPNSIKLTELKINPLNEKISKKGNLVFRSDTIFISGTCISPTVLNPWMEKVKSMDWVESVSNIGYNHDAKNKVGNFKVELIIRNEY
jgi:hypothetical protein